MGYPETKKIPVDTMLLLSTGGVFFCGLGLFLVVIIAFIQMLEGGVNVYPGDRFCIAVALRHNPYWRVMAHLKKHRIGENIYGG